MVVQEEGASPLVVGSYGELRLDVADGCVHAGARSPLEAGIRPLRDRVLVHHVAEAESL